MAALVLTAVAAMVVVASPAPAATDVRGAGAAATGINWHPGHYVLLDGILRLSNKDSLSTTHQRHIAALAGEDDIKGVKIFVQWSAVEGAEAGDYTAGAALIRKYVDWVEAIDKQLWISFLHTQFGGYDPNNLQDYFPDYIVRTYGLTQLDGDRGIMARIWQRDTMNRVIAKSRYYASLFGAEPRIEAIQIDETSISITDRDGFSNEAVFTQYERFLSAARADWPNTQVRLTANWLGGNSLMAELIARCASLDCAVGGPDTIPSQVIQANQIFTGAIGGTDYRGRIPFVSEVQSPELCGYKGCWTPRQLYDHAMHGDPEKGIRAVQPQYFIWYRNTWQGDPIHQWDTGILPFIRSINGAVHSTACPRDFPACITT